MAQKKRRHSDYLEWKRESLNTDYKGILFTILYRHIWKFQIMKEFPENTIYQNWYENWNSKEYYDSCRTEVPISLLSIKWELVSASRGHLYSLAHSPFKGSNSRSSPFHVSESNLSELSFCPISLLPLVLKSLCDYTGPTQIIHNKLTILRSVNYLCNILSKHYLEISIQLN